MSLKQLAIALYRQIRTIYERLLAEEITSLIIQPTGIDRTVFARLIGKILIFTIRRIQPKVIAIKSGKVRVLEFVYYKLEVNYDSYTYENRLRFSLPYYHILILYARDDIEFIPLSLIYPRWRLKPRYSDERLITVSDQRPSYTSTKRTLVISLKKADVYGGFNELLRIRESLPNKERERFDRVINSNFNTLRQASKRQTLLSTILISQPNTILKRSIKRKRKVESSRGLTANEIAEKE